MTPRHRGPGRNADQGAQANFLHGNRLRRWLGRFYGFVLMLGLAMVGTWQGVSADDIRSTPHNLAKNGTRVEADEVCVFCHTPQIPVGIDSKSSVAMHPAWQPSIKADHSFMMFDDIGRKQFGKEAVGSQSIACLSCHDASQAFQVTNSVADHPFGVPYKGFSRDRVNSPIVLSRADDEEGKVTSRAARYATYMDEFRRPSTGKVDNRSVWWVSATGVSPVRTRSDLPLYVRGSEGGEVPYVECGSCHDPHVTRPLFLRVANDGSKLCLTCHDK